MKTHKAEHKRLTLLFTICVLVFRLAQDYNYVGFLSNKYGYMGMYLSYSGETIIYSWILLALSMPLMIPFTRKMELASSQAIILLYLMRFVPFTSLVGYRGFSMGFINAFIIFWIAIIIAIQLVPNLKFKYIHPKTARSWLVVIGVVMSAAVIIVSGVYAHFHMQFSFEGIYDLRMDARNFHMPTLLAYLWTPAGNILPVLLVLCILNKKYKLVAALTFVIFLNFSINGLKSVIFKLFLCVGLIFVKPKHVYATVIIAFPLLIVLASLSFDNSFSDFISSTIVRRVLDIPVVLDNDYYNFFSTERMPVFFNSQEASKTAFDIGALYYDKPDMRVNNGLFSDAFMNMGWPGLFVFALIYAIFFKAGDSILKNVNPAISFFSMLMIINTIGSTTFTTSLLTHGVALLCLSLYFIASSERKRSQALRANSAI